MGFQVEPFTLRQAMTAREIPGVATPLPVEPGAEEAIPKAAAGYVPLALITLLGAFLRFYRLDHQSLWMDEVLTILSSYVPLEKILFDPPVDPNVPPLYYLVMAALQGLGAGEIALRAPSAVAGVLGIPLMYGIARTCLGSSGLLAALFLAVSPLHVWYSQEARPYALLILLALLAVRFLQHALASPRSGWARFGFTVTSVAAFYVHTVAIAFLAALAVYLLLVVPRRELRPWLVTFGAVALLSLPGVYLLLRIPPTVSANPFYVFDPSHVAYTLWTFGTGYSLGPNLIELRTEGMTSVRRSLLLIAPIMGLLLTLLALGLVKVWRERREALTLLTLWMTFPVAFVVLGTWVTSHPYNVRYALLALPPTLIILAAGTRFFVARVQVVMIGLVLVVNAAALWNYYTDPSYYRDDNRGAAAFIRAHAEPLEPVIASAAYTRVPLRHYLGDAPLKLVGYPTGESAGTPDGDGSLGAMFVQPEHLEADLGGLVGDHRTFWLFLSRTFHSDPEGHLRRHADLRYRRVAEYTGAGVQAIRYRRPDGGAPTAR